MQLIAEESVKKFDDVGLPECIEVHVGNNRLPLRIGDKIDVGDGIIRVVMKIQINEDTKVTIKLNEKAKYNGIVVDGSCRTLFLRERPRRQSHTHNA